MLAIELCRGLRDLQTVFRLLEVVAGDLELLLGCILFWLKQRQRILSRDNVSHSCRCHVALSDSQFHRGEFELSILWQQCRHAGVLRFDLLVRLFDLLGEQEVGAAHRGHGSGHSQHSRIQNCRQRTALELGHLDGTLGGASHVAQSTSSSTQARVYHVKSSSQRGSTGGHLTELILRVFSSV